MLSGLIIYTGEKQANKEVPIVSACPDQAYCLLQQRCQSYGQAKKVAWCLTSMAGTAFWELSRMSR